jgi:hypothetical protein
VTATLELHMIDDGGRDYDQCTGTVVSDDGNVMTAGHCVERCLRDAGAIRQDENISIVDRERMAQMTCRISIDNITYDAKVLATSDCRSGDDNKSGNSHIKCSRLDLAILKVALPVGTACFAMARKTPVARNNRGIGRLSRSKTLYAASRIAQPGTAKVDS